MIRLTVTLIVAIYIILIVVPAPDHGENVTVTRNTGQNWLVAIITDAEAEAQRPPRDRAIASVQELRASYTDGLIETDGGFVLETAEGEALEISAVIDPIELLHQASAENTAVARVSFVATADPETELASASTGAVERQIWRVTASAVNFRDGPSTNTRVLTSLRRGEEVEFIADAGGANSDFDWAHLRVISTGLEGYMAAEYLEPVN